MAFGALELILYLGLPLFLGTGLLASIGILPRRDRVSYLGWAWVAGSLGSAGILAAWLSSSPSSMEANWPAGWMLGCGLLGWAYWNRVRRPLAPEPASEAEQHAAPWERWSFRLALGFVLAVTLERILFGSLHAVVTTDEAAFWSFRAKVLFHEGGFGQAYADGIRQTGQSNADYPLLNPLLQLWAFVVSGGITHLANRFVILLFCPALVLVLAGALRRVLRPGLAALMLLLLANMQPFLFATAVGYSDLMVALGALLVLDAALRWRAGGERSWLWLGGMGLALAMASKNDGLLLVVALAGAWGLTWLASAHRGAGLRQALCVLPFGIPALLIYLLGKFHNQHYQFQNVFYEKARAGAGSPESGTALGNALGGLEAQFLERAWPICEHFGREIFLDWQHSSLLFPAFLILCVAAIFPGTPRVLRFGALFVGLLLLGLMLVFVSLPFELDYHLRTAAARVSIDALPALMLWLAAFAGMQLGLGPKAARASGASPAPRLASRALVGYLLLFAGISVVASGYRFLQAAPASFGKGLSWSTERRLKNALGREDSRYQLRHGLTAEVYDALLEHVPEEQSVLVNLPKDGRLKLAFSMQILTYPRKFRQVPLPASGSLNPNKIKALVGQSWVLDLIGLDAQLEPHFRCVARGEGWSLWR